VYNFLFHNFFLLGYFIEVKFEKMVDGPHLKSISGNLGGVSINNIFQTEAETHHVDRPSGASRSRQKLVRGALSRASTASYRSERLREGNRLRREAREALDKIDEAADRRLEIAKKRETEERERERACEIEGRAAHELEERAAGRQRSKERFKVRAALEEGLAALEDEDGDGDDDDEDDADADDVAAMGGNAITPAAGPARGYSHPQLHRISSHVSAEENPVTVNAPITATILNVLSSVIESRGANAVQSHKDLHIASTVCQISENQNVGARTNQCRKSGQQQTTTTDNNNSKQ
jgi:hypothetical protein